MTSTDVKTDHLAATGMLDFEQAAIQHLIAERGWQGLDTYHKIDAIYRFVKDEIPFGYNADDGISASEVLSDGYGQCNTKGTLLMALFRATGVPARIHGFTIYNALQKGAIPPWIFRLAPERILHSWVEVWFEGRWLELEGYIVDQPYLTQVQKTFSGQCEAFSGYGVATACLNAPQNEWRGDHTYIQNEGIADDFGVFDQPDAFYTKVGTNLRGIKRLLYRYVLRHLINRNVRNIRRFGIQNRPGGW